MWRHLPLHGTSTTTTAATTASAAVVVSRGTVRPTTIKRGGEGSFLFRVTGQFRSIKASRTEYVATHNATAQQAFGSRLYNTSAHPPYRRASPRCHTTITTTTTRVSCHSSSRTVSLLTPTPLLRLRLTQQHMNQLPPPQPQQHMQSRSYSTARPRKPRESIFWKRAMTLSKGAFEVMKAYFYPVLGITSVIGVLAGWYILNQKGGLRETFDSTQRTVVFRGVQSRKTPVHERFYRKDEVKALARAIDTLATDEMLLVVGPSGIGKSSLIEQVLEDDDKYEVCHIKMKGKSVTVDDVIKGIQEQFGFGWENELAGMKLKAGMLSVEKKDEASAEHPNIAGVLSDVESRITRTPPQNNRTRVIFVDDVTELRYLIEGKYFNESVDKFIVVKSLLKWLADMGPHCKVVLASSDGFTYRLLSSVGIMTNVRYHEVRDLTESQAREAVQQFLGGESMYHQLFAYGRIPPKKHFEGEKRPKGPQDINWKDVYSLIGGRISMLKRWSNSPTKEVLHTLDVEARGWLEEMMGQTVPALEDRSPPKFGPKALEYVFSRLVEDDSSAGDASRTRGVKLRKLLEGGITLDILESMSQYGIITLNHRQRRVTLPSRLMLGVLNDNKKLWHNPELKVMVRLDTEEEMERELRCRAKSSDALVSAISHLLVTGKNRDNEKDDAEHNINQKQGWWSWLTQWGPRKKSDKSGNYDTEGEREDGKHKHKIKITQVARETEDGRFVSVLHDDRQLLQLKNGDVLRVTIKGKKKAESS